MLTWHTGPSVICTPLIVFTSPPTISQFTLYATVTMNYLSSPNFPYCSMPEKPSIPSSEKFSLILTDVINFFLISKFCFGHFSFIPLVLHCTTNGLITVLSLSYSHSSAPIPHAFSLRHSCVCMCSDKIWFLLFCIDVVLIHGNGIVLYISLKK